MKVNTLGEFIKYYRQRYELSQDIICEGICSVSTISRVENGIKMVDSLVAEALLGRIGKEVFQFEILLNDFDFHLWSMRKDIIALVNAQKYSEAKALLIQYRNEMPQSESVHIQFCLYYEAQIGIYEGVSKEEICNLLYCALIQTMPDIATKDNKKLLYNAIEIELYVSLIHYGYSGWANQDKEYELLYILSLVEKIFTGRKKEIIGMHIIMELVSYEQKKGKMLQVIKYIDRAVEFNSKSYCIDELAKLHYIKAKALEQTYRDTSQWDTKYNGMCKKECLMAYYVFDYYNQEEDKYKIQKFCEERLGWQITE